MTTSPKMRRMPVWAFVLLVIVYLVVIQTIPQLTRPDGGTYGHSTNLFTEGPKAFAQVLVTAAAGYFFYLTRRVSGGLIVPILVHGFWDMGLFTNTINKDALGAGLGAVGFVLADVVLLILAIATFRKVWPKKVALAPAT